MKSLEPQLKYTDTGAGLYEDIYERSLCRELRLRNIPFSNQVQLPLLYKGES